MENMEQYPSSDANRMGEREGMVGQMPESDFPNGKPTREALAAEETNRMNQFLQQAKEKGISENEGLARWDILVLRQAHLGGAREFVALRDKWVNAVGDEKELSADKINQWPK
jgi:hypothetical protein